MKNITKCTALDPCPDQMEFFIKNDSYSLTGDCCSYCGVDLEKLCEELYGFEGHIELTDAEWEQLRNAPVEPNDALRKLLH